MQNVEKSLKDCAREAKKRLKSGFWQKCKNNLDKEIVNARMQGINESKAVDYYVRKVEDGIKGASSAEDEEFYLKVKKLLDEEGNVGNALGRLTDKTLYDTLTYEQKQKYNLNLSEKYLVAVERYNREKEMAN